MPPKSFSVMPMDNLGRSENHPALDWLWHGYVANGNPTLLTSLWKAAKTTLVAGLLRALASEGEFLGRRCQSAKALVVSQVTLSLVLLVGAGLFLRSLVNLANVDTGFNKENVLRLQADPSSIGYKVDEPRTTALYQQIEERVSALHGVSAASFSSFTFHEGSWNTNVHVAGFDTDPNINVKHNVIGNRYFATMQIPLVAGRVFGPQDTATSQRVGVISERMARTMFPKGNPIGHHYHIGSMDNPYDIEVVGIVKDVKFGDLQEARRS